MNHVCFQFCISIILTANNRRGLSCFTFPASVLKLECVLCGHDNYLKTVVISYNVEIESAEVLSVLLMCRTGYSFIWYVNTKNPRDMLM